MEGLKTFTGVSYTVEVLRFLKVTPSIFENELSADIPVVKVNLGGTRLVGRMAVGMLATVKKEKRFLLILSLTGNKNGLLLPNGTSDQGGFSIFSEDEE